MEEFTVKKIPREKRIRNALIALVVTVGLTGWALWYLYSQQQFGKTLFGFSRSFSSGSGFPFTTGERQK